MKTSRPPTRFPRIAALALACVLPASAAVAQTLPTEKGYLTDLGTSVVMSAYGLCWHTGSGDAPPPMPACDGSASSRPRTAVADPASPSPRNASAEPAPSAPLRAIPYPLPAETALLERVTFDADTLFDFDEAVLRPAGREALDRFVAKVRTIDAGVITAVGHTDRIGSERYNQRLSEQRVEAVRDYLVSQGIAPDAVRTEGRGKSEPVTKAGACEGAKSPSVLACLQPDRRVEIAVAGSRAP